MSTSKRTLSVFVAVLLLLGVAGGAPVLAVPNLDEVGALLIFPTVLNEATPATVETFLTIVNTAASSYELRMTFVDGSTCNACVFNQAVAAHAVVPLVVSRNASGRTEFRNQETGTVAFCPGGNGFVIVSVRNGGGVTLTDNVLFGLGVVIDYPRGSSLELAAVPFQGFVGDGNTQYEFDDFEYSSLPSLLTGNFLAPDTGTGGYDANITLFAPGFQNGSPPASSCSITGFDSLGGSFSTSFQFGCWTRVSLESLSAEFAYPNLGPVGFLESGSFQLQCSVNGNAGGVHGAFDQVAPAGTVLRRITGGPALATPANWARLLHQSVTAGASHVSGIETCNGLDDDGDGSIDEGCDDDNDGYCDVNMTLEGSAPTCPSGGGDCNDTNPAVRPGAAEVCNGLDDDCNGQADVPDSDGDGYGNACDCAPANPSVGAIPGQARDLRLARVAPATATLTWQPPATGGSASAMLYDVVRANTPSNFNAPAVCLETDDGPNTTATDATTPVAGQGLYYLVRAQNLCGSGIAGTNSADMPTPARTCP